MIVSNTHALVDHEGYASRAYAVTDDALILVRPDSYIGLTGSSSQTQPLIDYFHTVLAE